MHPLGQAAQPILAATFTLALTVPTLTGPDAASAGSLCDVKVTVSAGTASDGPVRVLGYEEFTVTGSGFRPNTRLTIEIVSPSMLHEWGAEWHPTTDATGSFSQPGVFVWNDDTGRGTLAAEDPDSEEWCDTVSLEIVRGHPFADVEYFSRWEREIAWLWQSGITAGCTSSLYCRDGAVTRGQMASFLARALELPPAGRDYFTDDEASRHEANINRIAEARITMGCGSTTFCPGGTVTREQMASFLARALDLPVAAQDYFADDEGSRHEENINRLRMAGITYGCTSTTFCPQGAVTRGQMAAFLFRAFHN